LKVIVLSKISIIIPTINEANNLPLLFSDLSNIDKEGKLLLLTVVVKIKQLMLQKYMGRKYIDPKKKIEVYN